MNINIDGIIEKMHGSWFFNLCADNKIELALLFGSAAQGKAVPDSDVDLALLMERHCYPGESILRGRLKRRMIRELSGLLRTSLLDLVILNQASPLLRHQVARTCKVLYENHPCTFTGYASLALRQHNDARLFYELDAAYLANIHQQTDACRRLKAGE